ncbi:unnamed protein product, partial [Brachionus calyciflorus]
MYYYDDSRGSGFLPWWGWALIGVGTIAVICGIVAVALIPVYISGSSSSSSPATTTSTTRFTGVAEVSANSEAESTKNVTATVNGGRIDVIVVNSFTSFDEANSKNNYQAVINKIATNKQSIEAKITNVKVAVNTETITIERSIQSVETLNDGTRKRNKTCKVNRSNGQEQCVLVVLRIYNNGTEIAESPQELNQTINSLITIAINNSTTFLTSTTSTSTKSIVVTSTAVTSTSTAVTSTSTAVTSNLTTVTSTAVTSNLTAVTSNSTTVTSTAFTSTTSTTRFTGVAEVSANSGRAYMFGNFDITVLVDYVTAFFHLINYQLISSILLLNKDYCFNPR